MHVSLPCSWYLRSWTEGERTRISMDQLSSGGRTCCFCVNFLLLNKLPMASIGPLLRSIIKLFKKRPQLSSDSDLFLTNTVALWEVCSHAFITQSKARLSTSQVPFIFKRPAQKKPLADVASPAYPDWKPCLSFLKTQEVSGPPSRTVLSRRIAFSTCDYWDLNLNYLKFKSTVPQSHQAHVKCSETTCG